jgi:hypothetical protein
LSALLIIIIVASKIILWVLPEHISYLISERVMQFVFGISIGVPIENYPEITRANTAHYAIANWVSNCLGAPSIDLLPPALQDFLESPRRLTPRFGANTPGPTRLPLILERGTLELSKTITSERISLAGEVDQNHNTLQIMTIVSIVIGLITTILVSLSSTEFGRGDNVYSRTIRIFSIIFPALGTAMAAVIAFYNPRDAMNKASHTLASLTQLHGQMLASLAVTSCQDAPDNIRLTAAKLGDWVKRYQDIETVANAVAGSSSTEPTRGEAGSLTASPPPNQTSGPLSTAAGGPPNTRPGRH